MVHGSIFLTSSKYFSQFDTLKILQRGNTPLVLAAKAGHTVACKELIEYGAEIHTTDEYGNNCLICAATAGSIATVGQFLEAGLDINSFGGTLASPTGRI